MVDRISASHILIMHNESKDSRSELSKDDAQKKIKEIHFEISSGNSSFKDMAMNNSDCSSASYGGSLGEFGRGVMVKVFEEKAFSLEVGKMSEPIETEFGFHIIKRDS